MEQYFEWDDAKAASNLRKHGIQFEDAVEVFDDPHSITKQDRIEGGEYRWQTLGTTISKTLLLLVAHTSNTDDGNIEIIRIISARKANRKERARYEHGQI
ncbi:hypothetical protein AXE65_01330 [Ventosimonas gracilis]|uniref:BrnT family toxin n=1 Tax=Ventosimonas gracilis TaxID=1680762 RepID=A0A139SV39_9GAMM|nr:BrnT family toxin [Ventosimonas gracilis]KXU38384.1 hypothetical protein AXE65_01330 [Ventosimonas gracilis]